MECEIVMGMSLLHHLSQAPIFSPVAAVKCEPIQNPRIEINYWITGLFLTVMGAVLIAIALCG